MRLSKIISNAFNLTTSEVKRLLKQGAIRIWNEESPEPTIEDEEYTDEIPEPFIISVGKKRWVKIVISQ